MPWRQGGRLCAPAWSQAPCTELHQTQLQHMDWGCSVLCRDMPPYTQCPLSLGLSALASPAALLSFYCFGDLGCLCSFTWSSVHLLPIPPAHRGHPILEVLSPTCITAPAWSPRLPWRVLHFLTNSSQPPLSLLPAPLQLDLSWKVPLFTLGLSNLSKNHAQFSWDTPTPNA